MEKEGHERLHSHKPNLSQLKEEKSRPKCAQDKEQVSWGLNNKLYLPLVGLFCFREAEAPESHSLNPELKAGFF